MVDPLDGTKNFLLGVEQFAVCLTNVDETGKVTAAVVYDPIRDRAYAADETGAYMNGQPITITQSEPRGTYLVTEENLAKRSALNRIQRVATKFAGVRKFGSTALDLAQMAAGQSCAVVATGLKPWDFQGAAFIYEKAGGKISDISGRPLTMESTTLIACPPKMHEDLVWGIKSFLGKVYEGMVRAHGPQTVTRADGTTTTIYPGNVIGKGPWA